MFYEKQLSANARISCASCHKQSEGLSDSNQFSTGFAGGLTARNSMGLANSRFYQNGHFFWDERADTPEDQALIPIQSDVEMGLTLAQAVSNLTAQPYYAYLFSQAFGDSTITSTRVAQAIAQFVRSIVSYQTRYDTGLVLAGNANNNFSNFTAEENQGKRLFFSNRTDCVACHVNNDGGNQAAFQPDRTFNNGLDATLVNADNGVGDVTGRTQDNGRFKSPSLRNIAITGPYMHDGRFATLAQVIDHYNTGVQNHPNLDNRLQQNGQPVRMNLNGAERDALVAFLNTLTDNALISDSKFSDPFRLTPLIGNSAAIVGAIMLLLDE